MKIFLFAMIILIGTIFSASAQELVQPQVSLLVSLQNPPMKPLFAKKDWSISQKIAKVFEKKMQSLPYKLNIIEHATQKDLFVELFNPANVALFWVSHANATAATGAGLSTENIIADRTGSNVRDLFQMIHPNLKYLGLIGCQAGPIIDDFHDKGFYADNDNLVIRASHKKVLARLELRRAIKEAKSILAKNDFTASPKCLQRSGHVFTVERIIGDDVSEEKQTSVQIEHKGKILRILPQGKAGEVQLLKFYLKLDEVKSAADLKFVINSGRRDKDIKWAIGKIKISSTSLLGEWTAFSDKNGQPLGVTSHVYRYEGPLELHDKEQSYYPFVCKDVAPVDIN
jgi:hypothetical protein